MHRQRLVRKLQLNSRGLYGFFNNYLTFQSRYIAFYFVRCKARCFVDIPLLFFFTATSLQLFIRRDNSIQVYFEKALRYVYI
jgi:hypothetical protein